jgi:hypothetical protein
MNSRNIARIFLFAITMLFVIGCDRPASSQHASTDKSISSAPRLDDFRVLGVNDYEFLFNNTDPGALINFGSNTLSFCTISFIRAKFVRGYTTKTTKLGQGDLDMTCLTDADHYSLNESSDTYVQMTVSELNDNAAVEINFALFGTKSKTLLKKENIKLLITTQQLKTMHIK